MPKKSITHQNLLAQTRVKKLRQHVKLISQQCHQLAVDKQFKDDTLQFCYQISCELERLQYWYDRQFEQWKCSTFGRYLGRELFRLHCSTSYLENLLQGTED